VSSGQERDHEQKLGNLTLCVMREIACEQEYGTGSTKSNESVRLGVRDIERLTNKSTHGVGSKQERVWKPCQVSLPGQKVDY
jgi:hypothetical protein